MSIAHPCLYTKHLVKKKKSWSDGFVVIKGSGVASLHAEDGSTLSSGVRLPAHATTSEEQIKAFDGYLVTIEPVACAADALPASMQSLLSAPAAGPTPGPTGPQGQPRGPTHHPKQQQGPHGTASAPATRVAPVISGRRPLAFMPPKPLGASGGAREATAPGAPHTAPAAPAGDWRTTAPVEQAADTAPAGQQATGWRRQGQPLINSTQLQHPDKPHGISAHRAPSISSLCPNVAATCAGGTCAAGPGSVWSSHAPGAATAVSNPPSARSGGLVLGGLAMPVGAYSTWHRPTGLCTEQRTELSRAVSGYCRDAWCFEALTLDPDGQMDRKCHQTTLLCVKCRWGHPGAFRSWNTNAAPSARSTTDPHPRWGPGRRGFRGRHQQQIPAQQQLFRRGRCRQGHSCVRDRSGCQVGARPARPT